MDSQPIVFDEDNKDPFEKIIRKSFRVPAGDSDNIWVKIGDIRYPLCDICNGGIGIALENPLTFTISQTIQDCELQIKDLNIKNLNGRVVHLSLNSDKDWQCGIQWIDMDKNLARQMAETISELKDELLKDDHSTG
ncbi:MAG: hypothetical protein ABIJ59_05655 [Pseudomonadota bacterium]